MKLKTLLNKVTAALLAVPFLPVLAHAFQMPPAHRSDYNGLTPHAHWDAVWHETMLDIIVIGVVFTAITVWFMIKYRRKGHGERGHLPKLSGQARLGWAVLPCMLFLGDDLFLFVKGWDLHNQYREPPADAYEIKVTANMWSWTYEYPNGVETYGELKVPVGKAVVLRMMSEDVLHSHYMNRYRVTEDVMPGRVTYQWFMPDQLGESVVTCREYCGQGHSNMYGKAMVMPQSDWDSWMATELASISPDSGKATDVAAATDQPSASSILGGKS
ncbi:MAG: cytochrome c oxidase subunit II [Mariprofundaceae bacterium]